MSIENHFYQLMIKEHHENLALGWWLSWKSECVLYKHEDLSLDSKNLRKSWAQKESTTTGIT